MGLHTEYLQTWDKNIIITSSDCIATSFRRLGHSDRITTNKDPSIILKSKWKSKMSSYVSPSSLNYTTRLPICLSSQGSECSRGRIWSGQNSISSLMLPAQL